MITHLEPFNGNLFRDVSSIARHMRGILGEGRPLNPGFLGFPAINVGANDQQVDVYMFAPGLDREKLEVSIHQNHLTISGERGLGVSEAVEVRQNERFHGQFRRLVTLPKDVDPERVEASYKDGVLHIKVARKEPAPRHKIEIQ